MTARAQQSTRSGRAPVAAAARDLEAALGHTFRNAALLCRALSHKSSVAEAAPGEESWGDNEQLEFLGDSVLGFLVSDALVRRFPMLGEGRLSKLKAHLVSSAHLHTVAQGLNLGAFLRLGRGEEMSGGREKKGLLANALEALIAAVYLDGGLEAAGGVVCRHIIGGFDPAGLSGQEAVLDFKSALQELAQRLKLPAPQYHTVGEQGPEHAKTFTVEVRLGKNIARQGQGSSKKSAGQRAAQRAYEDLLSSRPEGAAPGPS